MIANPGQKELNLIRELMIKVYANDNKDPMLELIFNHSELSYRQVIQILSITEHVNTHRDEVGHFVIHLIQTHKLDLFLQQISDVAPDERQRIFCTD